MAEKGSDVLIDFCCNVCEEENLTKEAMFYCQQCNKGLCNDCIGLHNQFYKMHVANGRSEMEKWPVKKKLFEELKFCQQHKDQPIEMYCEDHSKLCCSMCLFHEHR
ncbi:hypothetical protein DPMN_082439 [Dreissena polymorpha]|uniref:B box-type domain-containing protein n=1 Tax=Dreissena polymorpha TaxID=45954 RepID=A0A9D3Y858_DREPO|nr:hypothetical protein DPMN_082439 [Dreissena polymorpha]